MAYYEVLVSSPRFHGSEPLTYSGPESLAIGAVVAVPMRTESIMGIVVGAVRKPSFTTKPIEKVVTESTVPSELLALLIWMQSYYPAPLGVYAQLLLPTGLLRQRALPTVEPARKATTKPLPALASQQQAALDSITTSDNRTFLLHGDTGTGKTRVYLELARKSLAEGRSVLMLTPEIGLTPQLETRLKEGLPAPVITIHSRLTPAQRRTVWLQILRATEPIVVVGPRSALFAPVHNLGLIVIDEAHDQAYKQEQAPHYQTLRVAAQLATLHRAKLILGTATPAVADYFIAEQTDTPILRLTDLPAGEHIDRNISIVNLRDRSLFPRTPHLSQALIEHIQKALERKEQSLIFLNRRGTARLVLCYACDWQALCPHCDLPLTYHGDTHQLRCHTCGYTQPTPLACPQCKSVDILFKSLGTKALVDELHTIFPHAKIQRFDTDNMKAERLEEHASRIADGEVDILVGTQILAKGLDLPKLSVVGVITADTSLSFPDYTAEEQTFQLLTQVIGRVGRGHKHGNIVIQSYNPDSPIIQAAVQQDWKSFYSQQLSEREAYGFPPFYHVLKLSCTRASRMAAQAAATKLKEQLEQSGLRIVVIGPTPSFYERMRQKYSWQLVVKAKSRSELLKVLPLLPAQWSYDLDPANLL